MEMCKRSFLLSGVAAVGGLLAASCGFGRSPAESEQFEVMLSPGEWRARLTPERYAVLREADTERPGSSPLDLEKRAGTYACAGCDLPVYSSKAKYDSGTGWPSFTRPLGNAIRTRPDRGLLGVRTEVICRRCGGHLGHVFDDGPPPTGQRWCMNGLALKFVPGAAV